MYTFIALHAIKLISMSITESVSQLLIKVVVLAIITIAQQFFFASLLHKGIFSLYLTTNIYMCKSVA